MRLVTDVEAPEPTEQSTAETKRAMGSEPAPTPAEQPLATVASRGAAVFSLIAFLIALTAGAIAGNDASSVLARALVAMAVCWPLAWISIRIVAHTLRAARGSTVNKSNLAGNASESLNARTDRDVRVVGEPSSVAPLRSHESPAVATQRMHEASTASRR